MDLAPNLDLCCKKEPNKIKHNCRASLQNGDFIYSSLPTNLLIKCRSNAVRRHKLQIVGFLNTIPWLFGKFNTLCSATNYTGTSQLYFFWKAVVITASCSGVGPVNSLNCVRSKPQGGLQIIKHRGDSSMLEHCFCF